MFSMVPYVISERNNPILGDSIINHYVDGSSKLLVPGRVTAATGIPQGSMSLPIQACQLTGLPDIVQISVGVNQYGTLDLEDTSKETWSSKDTHWIRALRLSDDCHSYNVQLRLQPSQRGCGILNKNLPPPKLILEAVRPIEAGQELLLWFSEDILALLQMVFLTPANIQGQKKYVCTRCSALYESPNPLKLHITLSCGRFSIASMWEKLSKLLADGFFNEQTNHGFDFKLQTENASSRTQKNAIDLSTSVQPSKIAGPKVSQNLACLYRPYNNCEPSAFKPFQKTGNDTIKFAANIVDQMFSNTVDHLPGFIQNWQMLPFQPNQTSVRDGTNDEAQIETLVSSLGKSKEGHVCLYCGKCYSRKYGLKIHIRTHTGYKPLKCKFCLRPFGDPSNLNKHVRLHAEGDTPYKCDLCGKILVRRRDLERHLKSRHVQEMHPDAVLEDEETMESGHQTGDETKVKYEIEEEEENKK